MSQTTRKGIRRIQNSGEVLQVEDSRTANLGDRILNSFTPLHHGTFGGLPTRIFYIFVGLTPLILFITGSRMFVLRKWIRAKQQEMIEVDSPGDRLRQRTKSMSARW